MAETETIRIVKMSEGERTMINALSSEERKEVLLRAARVKIQHILSLSITGPELARKFLSWIERTRSEMSTDGRVSENHVIDRADVLIDDIEELCRQIDTNDRGINSFLF